ncbi:MAG: helix-turn-helix transcriptional regulator [Parasporobacterium sp.]|jgi:ribosome-binding protein aMBF1 (putative translation factor)|nr:helix-turn-helix transcriptional regulator [Lachnospiraceae bacterium]MBR3642255.1 helix-turn-helix transcriptional regulator [Parasporobacterium sp.]MDO4207572.1 helix-turn-helix transcriptional regulator [Lachnospiraceae bacterium]
MANKVGKLIKKARTDAGLTQEELARKVKGVSASDISKAERGEIRLTNEALKKIAKVTGVTQKSLTDAAASSTYSKQGKTSTTKPKQSSSTKPKQSSSTASKSSMQVTATEKKLVQLYRKADADSKKKAMAALKGTEISDVVESFIGNAIDSLFKK